MSSSASVVDALIKEYFVFRGFAASLKQFESDLKLEKERGGFPVDKVVEQICSSISAFDLRSLRELWNHLENKVYVYLTREQSKHADQLRDDLYRYYLVVCVQNRRTDKAAEFFEVLAPSLHAVEGWTEWFGMPYLPKPQDHPAFRVYFTREWQETYLTSLNNFLSIAFRQMHLPTLLSFVAEQRAVHVAPEHQTSSVSSTLLRMQAPPSDVVASNEVMDDFYMIAPESPAFERKSLTSVIKRKFGGGGGGSSASGGGGSSSGVSSGRINRRSGVGLDEIGSLDSR